MELSIQKKLQRGVALHREGKLQEAERLYREVLQSHPAHSYANYNLGIIAVSLNKADLALPLFKAALQVNPKIEQFWLSYIEALIKEQHFEAANQAIQQAKKQGLAGQNLNGLEDKLLPAGQARASTKTNNASPQKRSDLSEHYRKGRFSDAEKLALQIIQDFPKQPFAWKVLGAVFATTGRMLEAAAASETAVALSPLDAEAHSNFANTLQELGRLEEAKASYQKAIALNPNLAEVHYNLGITLRKAGKLAEAVASYTQAIALQADHAHAHSNLGITLSELGRLEEAETSYNRAIASNPDLAEAHNNLGNTLRQLGRLAEAEASYKRALTLRPFYAEAHSNLLFLISSTQFYLPHYQGVSRHYAECAEEAVTYRFDQFSCVEDTECLRVGFVSGDLKSHPVGYFLEGLLTQLQSSSMKLFAYPTVSNQDELTGRLRALFHEWSPLVGLSDKDAAQKIHSDGIHILIDLSGHTAKNRLPVFAWKPAPIQVSWLGYFASTGLSEMDYILGDPHVTPYVEAPHFTEKIWQLPESYLCFTPPDIDLKVAPLPACSNGFVTFGCFNSLSRMTDEIVSVRAAILLAVPGSKLFLKDKQLDHESGCNRVLSRFAAVDIAADRLILEGRSPRGEYLECYDRVDIALAPFPYGGGTTSVEGLWMGVPFITKKGTHFLSHLGESIAHNSGLSDWVASDEGEYIARAVAYAHDLKALSLLRNGMREQILRSPLFDTKRFAKHFEQAVRAMRNEIR
jgi:protein O-GlcNAc transferase